MLPSKPTFPPNQLHSEGALRMTTKNVKIENLHCQPDKPWDENKYGSQKDMSEFEPLPKITYELPDGDQRKIEQVFLQKTDDGYHVCLSIEHPFDKRIDFPIKLEKIKTSKDGAINQKIENLVAYQPETIAIPTLEVENIVDALEAGLEHTQTVLAEHDASLGRSTRKNQSWAEILEKDITLLRTRISFLKEKLVGVTTHYL